LIAVWLRRELLARAAIAIADLLHAALVRTDIMFYGHDSGFSRACSGTPTRCR